MAAALGPLLVKVRVPVSVWPAVPLVGKLTVTETSALLDALSTAWLVLLARFGSAVVVVTTPVEVTLAPVPTTKLKV